MEKEFYNKYMKYNFPGLTGPLKKTQKYNSIDYTKAYALISKYKKNRNENKTNADDFCADSQLSYYQK